MRARFVAGAIGVVLLSACTGVLPERDGAVPTAPALSGEPTTADMPGSLPSASGADRPAPDGDAHAAPFTEPLVLAVHATRQVADVPIVAARRLVAEVTAEGRASARWAELGQPGGGRARVRMALSAAAARALLSEVRRAAGLLAIVPASAVGPAVRVLPVGGHHPLREPATYPLGTPATTPPGEVTTLTVVGDVMLGRRVASTSGPDRIRTLRPTAKRLASAEITVGNLESTLSDAGAPTQGGDSFHADPEVIEGLELAGFDLVSLANNHVGDYGPGALRETLATLRNAGLPFVGAGRNLAEARRPVILARDGVRVGFLAIDSIGETPAATAQRPGTNRLNMPPRTGPLNQSQLARITGDIERLARSVDVLVVLTHWGTQYTHRPEPSQRRAARAFAAAGADLVIGGHPHWVQGWETIGDTVVVHSLGNFVFDMDFQTKTMEGVFVEIVLWDGQVKAVEPVAYRLDRRFVPRVVTGPRAAPILADVWSTSLGPFAEP